MLNLEGFSICEISGRIKIRTSCPIFNVMYNLFRFCINNLTLHKEETIVKYYILLEILILQKERRKNRGTQAQPC